MPRSAAPATDEAAGDARESNLIWAARQILNGRTVRRRGWIGNKTVSATHPSGRSILENEDLLAEDWEVV